MSSPSPRPPSKALPPLFRAALRPIAAFFHLEAAGAILLGLAALAALCWANSPVFESYAALLHLPVSLGLGPASVQTTLAHVVNDGLMTLFFFVVGMEIKRELAVGELSTPARALLPAIAAVGGMVVPALVFLAFNRGTEAASGWGVPMATDIAFAIGVLTVLKARVPHSLIVFLTALAIFDDLGGILVIAIFYGHGLQPWWLAAGALVAGALFAANRRYVRSGFVYLALGAALWYALHAAGIHATLAGVAVGLAVPVRPSRPWRDTLTALRRYVDGLLGQPDDEDLQNEQVLRIEEELEDIEPPLPRFVHLLHPWVAFVIVPLFALFNAGVRLEGVSPADLLAPLPLGIALGLVVGKAVGIFGTTALALKLRAAPMPTGGSYPQIFGVALVAGIGFTVALFIAQLAFKPESLDEAKLGILAGSLVAGLLGFAVLRFGPAPKAPSPAGVDTGPAEAEAEASAS